MVLPWTKYGDEDDGNVDDDNKHEINKRLERCWNEAQKVEITF